MRDIAITKPDFGRLHWTLRYGCALGFVVCALLLNSLPALRATPFLCFFAAVALSARVCGFGPALFATGLSAVAAEYFVASPRFLLSQADLVRLLFFLLVALLISNLAKRSSQLERIGAENRAELAAIVEYSADAIFSKTLDGTITSWNTGAEKLYGWPADEIIGKNVLLLVTPERQSEITDILNRLRQGEAIEHHETQRVRKDGSPIDVSVSIAPLFDGAGKTIGAASIVRDITARKLTDETLRKTEKLAAAGRLAATIAHEINNPLASVTNLIYLLQRNRSLDDKARTHLALADQEVRRVAHLARQTLGFYRDSSSAITVDLGLTLDEVLGIYVPKLESRRITVHKNYAKRVEVIAFPGEIRQVFSNLIANAIDAMDTGGRLFLKVSTSRAWRRPHSRGGRVTISDSGSGISPEHRPKLFEPFYTTKKDVGTGLGLWVCRQIIEKHGGSISVRSRVRSGRSGSVFSVFLPQVTDGQRIESKPQGLSSKLRRQTSPPTIA